MAIPDWLSIQEISRLWGEETGHDPSAFQKDLREWFAEFVKEPPTSRQLVPGVNFDTIIANRLLGMLGAHHLERRTFEAYCEERGHSKPRFWFADWEAGREPTGPLLEQPQRELVERPAAASAQAAELKAQPEAAERRGSVNYRNPQTNGPPLQQVTTRQKRRGRAILVAGLTVPLVALLLWGAETFILLAAAQRDIAHLSEVVEASDSLIAKLRDELVMVRQAVEASAGTREQLDVALASAVDAEKNAARARAATARLRGENSRLTNELTKTKALFYFLREVQQQSEDDVQKLREERAAGQEVAATQPPAGPVATTLSDENPVADQKDPDQTQDAEDFEAALEIEEILTAAKISSDPVTSETNTPRRDKVSPDDLLLEPGHYVDREVVVTGSVVWLLRRYWFQSDSGHMRMVIDVEELQSDVRNKLKDAVVKIEFLAQVRARITGMIERQGSENYRLAATELVLVE
jgi:hypothetical protein